MNDSAHRTALTLFGPLAPGYERWGAILSMGQDARWRQRMVDGLDINPGSRVLDIAAGTGLITRLLQSRGAEVISLDQSYPMLEPAVATTPVAPLATAGSSMG